MFASHQAGEGEIPEHSRSKAPNSSPAHGSLLQCLCPGDLLPFCDMGVLRLQHISSKIEQTFHYALVFALSVGALQVAMFTAAPTANVALFMIQKKTCHFLFFDC